MGAPKRGRPPSLTQEQIVSAAIKLSGEVRLENISMRALARELGASVMTLYNYVPSKDALHDLVLNHVLLPVRVPGPDEGSWEERIRRLERDARRALSAHPGISFRGGGATAPEQSVRLAQGVLSILSSGGFGPDDAALVFATMYTFVIGQLEVDAMEARGGDLEATLAGVMQPAGLSREQVFEFGFDAVIEGLKAKLGKTGTGEAGMGTEQRTSKRRSAS